MADPSVDPPLAEGGQSDYPSALFASFLGWTLDAFDFFLVVVSVPLIAHDFGEPVRAVALSIGVTLAFRPVGAFLFGLLADRYGRRIPMMADLVFYSVVEVLSGLAPNFTVFLILRALFGIGMGAEWGVGASLAMEKVPPRWRGVLSGLLQEGYSFGYLLAAACSFFVVPYFHSWRPMFFIGGLPALLALYIRVRVKESAVWEKTRHTTWTGLVRQILSEWKTFLFLALLMTMMNLASHGTQDMYPTFLQKERHFSSQEKDLIIIIYNVGAILGGIAFGFLSDRMGRRRSMVMALVLGILVVPLWAYGSTTPLLILGAFLLQFMVQGAWGIIPAHITELSPDAVRGFLPGFAYQCGVLLAGSISFVQAVFSERFDYASAMALTAVSVFALGALVVGVGPEKRGAVFGLRSEQG
jgi:SHS family lactate transporter-like MFS transporter